MNIKDVTSFFDKAKKTTQDASHALADKAVSVADKTQAAVVSAATSIKDNIQHKKDDEAKARKDKRDSILSKLQGTIAPTLIDALCDSPVIITKSNTQKIKKLFPIPVEQHIIWADAEFDLRPSGIVCTDAGVFVKTNVSVWEINQKKKSSSETGKSILFYYK